jgi:hypothetical protein
MTRREATRLSIYIAAPIVLVHCLGIASTAAEPKLTRFYPPAVGVGQTWTVTAQGTFDKWPVDVHVFPSELQPSNLQVKCLEKKGQIELVAAHDCPVGRYWVRFSNADGWSDAQPIIVSSAAATLEPSSSKSPGNDRLNLETSHALPALFAGKLEKGGDVDTYTVLVKANQPLTVSVTSNEVFSSPADCVLQIVSSQGFVLAQNDDERNLDPMVRWTPEADGLVAIRLFCFPVTPNSTIAFAGGGDYLYLMEATQGAYLDYTIPLAANKSTTTAQAVGWQLTGESLPLQTTQEPLGNLSSVSSQNAGWFQPAYTTHRVSVITEETDGATLELPIDASGELEKDGDTDQCQFEAKKGMTYLIEIQSRRFGLRTDPKLSILNSEGKSLASSDDIARDKRDVSLKWKSPSDQTVQVEVRDAHERGGDRYAYRILVAEQLPQLTMATAKDWLLTDAKKGGQLAVDLTWTNGLKTELELSAVDKTGQVVATTKVPAAAKKVALKLPPQSGAWQPLTIQAQVGDGPPTVLHFQKSGLSSNVVWVK